MDRPRLLISCRRVLQSAGMLGLLAGVSPEDLPANAVAGISLNVGKSLRCMRRSSVAALFVALLGAPPNAFAQPMPPGNEQDSMPGMESPQKVVLAQEIAQLRSRIAQIQAALGQNDRDRPVNAGMQPVGMAMDDGMAMSGAPNKPAMNSTGMPMAAGCCSGMMGKMGMSGSAAMTMPSDMPGFPGASHIYHVGATGFFLDYPTLISLTGNQQAALNGIKEKSVGDLAAAQRQIDQAEQELWILTSSGEPDSMKLETKVRDIERLKGNQRIAFIRSVGEAARVLTADQRAALLGTSAPQGAQAAAPEGSSGSVKPPQGGMGSTDPKGGMSGTPGSSNPGMGDM